MTISDLIVRPFDAADLSAILSLEQDSAAEPRPVKHFSPNEVMLVAVLDRQIVGYAHYVMPSPPFAVYLLIHRLLVKKALRRRGIGQALLTALITISDQHFSCVYTTAVPVGDDACRQLMLKNEFEDAGMQAYQCQRYNMLRAKRRWKLIKDGGSFKPVPADE